MTHYFCIAHKNLLFNPNNVTKIICTGDFNKSSKYHIINSNKKLYNKYSILNGTAGTFYINELLADCNTDDFVHITMYRKFLLPTKYDISNQNFQISIRKDKLYEIDMYDITTDYLFSFPVRMIPNVIGQYSTFHEPSDFLKFISCALDVNVISKSELSNFLTMEVLIPGGIEIGKFPVSIYREIVSKLELVADCFLKNNYQITNPTDDIQNRALSFCFERLSSWLLIKHLEKNFNINFIKNGNFLTWENDLIVNKICLNFTEYMGYLHIIN